jgi:UDP-galactopyranose mutase
MNFRAEGDPYYLVPRPENAELYKKYQALAEATPHTYFVGRLATYKYYNIDQVVAQALTVFKKISGEKKQSGSGRARLRQDVSQVQLQLSPASAA